MEHWLASQDIAHHGGLASSGQALEHELSCSSSPHLNG
jgi:hypothetical protein